MDVVWHPGEVGPAERAAVTGGPGLTAATSPWRSEMTQGEGRWPSEDGGQATGSASRSAKPAGSSTRLRT